MANMRANFKCSPGHKEVKKADGFFKSQGQVN